MRKKDFFSALFFLGLSVLIFAQSFAIKMSKADSLGPQFFPRLVAYTIAILAVIQVYRYLRSSEGESKQEDAPKQAVLHMLGTVGILVAYFLFLKYIGFLILTAIYLFCQIMLLLPEGSIKNRKYLITALLVSVISSAGIYYLFYYAFTIFLPPGILG